MSISEYIGGGEAVLGRRGGREVRDRLKNKRVGGTERLHQ